MLRLLMHGVKPVFAFMRAIVKKIRRKILKKIRTYQKQDAVTLHSFFLFSLIFIFFLFGLTLFVSGERIKNGMPEIDTMRYPTRIERNIRKLVSNYPIREMTPFIAEKDKKVAAYLVAIAKKESNWGKYSPYKNGKTCYNYWGYRGTENRTLSGYSCFNSPQQAVDIVGERLEELIDQEIDTPQKMVVWKCGSNCISHESYSVRKWIADVDLYFQKIYN